MGTGGFAPSLWTLLVLSHGFAALVAAMLAGYVGRNHWEKQIGRVFAVMVGTFVIWILGSLGRFFTTDPGLYVATTTVKYVGITTAPVLFFLFAALYAGKDRWVTRRIVISLLVLPGVTLLVLATTLSHGLFYSGFTVMALGDIPILATTPGPWFWLFAAFGWGLLVVGSMLFIYAGVTRPGLYRTQTAIVILAILITWVTNLVYVFWDWPHPALDPTPFGFAVASLLLAAGIFNSRLIEIVPMARSLVLDSIDDAVIVLDTEGRVVDVNDAASALLTVDRPIGKLASDVVSDVLVRAPVGNVTTVARTVADETRWYHQRRVPVGPQGSYGQAIVLTDVTEQMRIQRDLERQNKRLEEFASVASHDLRNPLTVAAGRLVLVREEYESEHLEEIARAHDRMEALIDDLLVLARADGTATTVEPVSLPDIVDECWRNVATAGATLDHTSTHTIRADRGQLMQLFENLIRNAIEHGGDDVTVTVGDLENGFYLEDTGAGISGPDRTRVFESGYSTSHDGTGFGLSIVKQIAEDHHWDVRVIEGLAGGARFEFRGVDRAT